MSPSASRVAWYRFWWTLRARWTGYLALALLKTLGFTRSQLAAAVTWQSTAAVLIGVREGDT